MKTTITPAPALAHDAMMKRRFNEDVSPNGLLERAIVWNLCQHLAAAGFAVAQVRDGDDDTEVTDATAALNLIFNLDQAWLVVAKGDSTHTLFLVIGEGDTIVSDWTFSTGDPDGFNAAMGEFDAEAIAPALLTGSVDAADEAHDICDTLASALRRMLMTIPGIPADRRRETERALAAYEAFKS